MAATSCCAWRCALLWALRSINPWGNSCADSKILAKAPSLLYNTVEEKGHRCPCRKRDRLEDQGYQKITLSDQLLSGGGRPADGAVYVRIRKQSNLSKSVDNA